MYTAYSLPARALECQYEKMTDHKDKRGLTLHSKLCGRAPAPRGFCSVHSFVLEMLDLADTLGYPAMLVNQHLAIGRGVASWEGYAVRHTPARHKNLLQQIRAAIRDREEQNAAAVMNALQDRQERQEIGLVSEDDKMYAPF